ncbi:MAG: DUF4340 domain-containing protein [Lentimicrobiaceae bacterium]|nr:DUF4340 domain-containing protein [Lentimicrobiaceae bacterium]
MMNNKRKNRLLLALALVILALLGILVSRPSTSTLRQKASQFAVTDTAGITRIFLADKEGRTILLEKEPIQGWRLNGTHTARAQAVDQLLSTLLRMAVSSPVPMEAHNSVIARLAATGVKVEVYEQSYRLRLGQILRLFPYEKRVRTFYVGDNTQDNMGTFMLMEGADRPYIIYIPGFRGFISTRFSTMENDWRDHTIFANNVLDIASVKLEVNGHPEQSYTIENVDNRRFNIIPHDPELNLPAIDSMRILTYLTTFSDIKFEVLLNERDSAFIDSVRYSPYLYRITVTDRQGNENTVVTHRRMLQEEEEFDLEGFPVFYDRDRMYAFVNDGRDFVLVQFFVFDRVTRPVAWFFEGTPLPEEGSYIYELP